MIPDQVSQSTKSLSIIDYVAIFLTSLILGAFTVYILAILSPSTYAGKIGVVLISVLPMAALCVVLIISVIYFIFLKKFFKKRPDTARALWLMIVLSLGYFYIQFSARNKTYEAGREVEYKDGMYPSHISTHENGYIQGDLFSFKIVPDVTNYLFQNVISLSISLSTPSGAVIKQSVKVYPMCAQERGCAYPQDFGLMASNYDRNRIVNSEDDRWYHLDEIGTYTITSENPIVKGTTFEVLTKDNMNAVTESIGGKFFPDKIGLYKRESNPIGYGYEAGTGIYRTLYLSQGLPDINVSISLYPDVRTAKIGKPNSQTYNTDYGGYISITKADGKVGRIEWLSGTTEVDISPRSLIEESYVDPLIKIFLFQFPSTP